MKWKWKWWSRSGNDEVKMEMRKWKWKEGNCFLRLLLLGEKRGIACLRLLLGEKRGLACWDCRATTTSTTTTTNFRISQFHPVLMFFSANDTWPCKWRCGIFLKNCRRQTDLPYVWPPLWNPAHAFRKLQCSAALSIVSVLQSSPSLLHFHSLRVVWWCTLSMHSMVQSRQSLYDALSTCIIWRTLVNHSMMHSQHAFYDALSSVTLWCTLNMHYSVPSRQSLYNALSACILWCTLVSHCMMHC